jgi:hypothetical protein
VIAAIQRCDCCAEPLPIVGGVVDYATDDEVCEGSDAPGFYLCTRPDCARRYDGMMVADRRVLFGNGRALGEEIERTRRDAAVRDAPIERDGYGMRVMRDADDLAIRIAREVDAAAAELAGLRPTRRTARLAAQAHAYQRIAALVEAYTSKFGVDVADQVAAASRAGVL